MRRGPGVLAAALLLPAAAAAQSLTLTSADLGAGFPASAIYDAGGCTGGNVSPDLHWSGVPVGAGSLAVTIFDPDAGSSGWWHWLVYDIPAAADGLASGAGSGFGLPSGARQGRSSFGSVGYGGPCPPPGTPHRYQITLYVLGPAHLASPPVAPAALAAALRAQALATASMTVSYGR